MSASDNAAILASALTSLTGSPVITQSDYLHQRLINGNNATYQNINPVSLHNSYLAGGAVSTIPQQNNNIPYSSSNLSPCNLQRNGSINQQQYFCGSNPQPQSSPHSSCTSNCTSCFPTNQTMMSSLRLQQPQQQSQPQILYPQPIRNFLQQQPQQPIQQITICICTLSAQKIMISNVPTNAKIFAIKFHIEKKTGISPNNQRLVYSGITLMDILTLSDYNINNNSIIYLIGQMSRDVISFIDSNCLDPKFDCDFTNIVDNNRLFTRGSHIYRRPCGWRRIAIKVLDKYGPDNSWLGSSIRGTWRYESDPLEWPVSYHGTDKFNAKSIAETGFDITKGKRFKFGIGVYSTPDINIAALYAKRFTHNNEIYCLVFQNRVNPNALVRINTNMGEYWISPNSDDIRPYGICIKKLCRIQVC